MPVKPPRPTLRHFARHLMIVAACLLAALLAVSPARANCSATSGTATLTTTGSFNVFSAAQGAAAASGFTCAGSGVLTLLTTNTVSATIQGATNSSGTQPRLYNSVSGDYIPFDICRTSACANTYPIGSVGTWSSTTLLGLLNLFTGPNGNLPLYMRTVPGTHVAAGDYSSVITIRWDWNICTIGAIGLCITRDTGFTISTLTVNFKVANDCIIGAPAIDFGSAPLTGSFNPVTRTITIRCSKGAAYNVGIDNGTHPSGSIRRLSDGTGFIAYDLFYPAGSTSRWGSAGAERRSSSVATSNAGLYNGATSQTYTYTARITAGQATPAAGTYTDTLTIDVQF